MDNNITSTTLSLAGQSFLNYKNRADVLRDTEKHIEEAYAEGCRQLNIAVREGFGVLALEAAVSVKSRHGDMSIVAVLSFNRSLKCIRFFPDRKKALSLIKEADMLLTVGGGPEDGWNMAGKYKEIPDEVIALYFDKVLYGR